MAYAVKYLEGDDLWENAEPGWYWGVEEDGQFLDTFGPFADEKSAKVNLFEETGKVIKELPGVATGLKKSNYIKQTGGRGGGRTATPITTNDPKFDMYANALPKAIRQKVVDAGLDVRAIYKEYRQMGREALVAKYS